jgi:hypothetical protein
MDHGADNHYRGRGILGFGYSDAERFMTPPARREYSLNYLPHCIGVSRGNRGVLVPAHRKFASLDEAKALERPPGFRPWIDGPDGFHTYAFGRWQFTPQAA